MAEKKKRRTGGHQPRDADAVKKSDSGRDTQTGAVRNKTLDRARRKAEKAAVKTERAGSRSAQKKEYKLVRRCDEDTGRVTYGLEIRKAPGKMKKENAISAAGRRAVMESFGFVHRKIAEHEKDNSGVEAFHKTEQAAEDAAQEAVRHKTALYRFRKRRLAALEKKQFRAETAFRYQKFLEENPEIKKKAFQKRLQKQRIKREYAKALKKGADAKNAAGYARKAAQRTTKIAGKLQELARKHIGAVVTMGLFGLFFMVIAAGVSSCGTIFSGGLSNVIAGSYQSEPAQLDASEEAMTLRELDLRNTIDNIESDYPDYDEYRYNLAEIGHDPFTLVSYLSAVYLDYSAAAVDADIESLFDEMYELTLTPTTETRTRTVTRTGTRTVIDEVTLEETEEEYEYEEEEEYTVTILNVELAKNPLEGIAAGRLAGNSDAAALYEAYRATNGAVQQFYSPLALDWHDRISSYYGHRRHPITGAGQFHRGVDIAVPEGTEIYAAQDGTVTTAQYSDSYGNYVVITDSEGYVTKYAHMQSLNVSAGQTVRHGDLIGGAGNTGISTGSHLHIECMYNGTYYNPLFYFENGSGSP